MIELYNISLKENFPRYTTHQSFIYQLFHQSPLTHTSHTRATDSSFKSGVLFLGWSCSRATTATMTGQMRVRIRAAFIHVC